MQTPIDLSNYYALIIGVGGDDIAATVGDAMAISKVMSDPKIAGYPRKNVILLTAEKATRKNILAALDQIVEKTAIKKSATVLIYFSGHGYQLVSTDEGTASTSYFLVPHGFDLEKPDKTMLDGHIFSERIDSIKSDKMVVLLDCCHASGIKTTPAQSIKKSLAPGIKKASEKKITFSTRELIANLSQGKGRVFVSSCDDSEESFILPDSKYSLFTEVILEALRGTASGNDPYVKVIDLLYHILREVPSRETLLNVNKTQSLMKSGT